MFPAIAATALISPSGKTHFINTSKKAGRNAGFLIS